MSVSDDSERRREPRYPTQIDVDVSAAGTFLFAQITDISSMGIFVQAELLHPPGTRLTLRFAPPAEVYEQLSEPDQPFEAEGEVMWITDDDGGHPPGMGVRFVALPEAQRLRLLELITAIAYFGDES